MIAEEVYAIVAWLRDRRTTVVPLPLGASMWAVSAGQIDDLIDRLERVAHAVQLIPRPLPTAEVVEPVAANVVSLARRRVMVERREME